MEEICERCQFVNTCVELMFAHGSQEEYGLYLAKADNCKDRANADGTN